MENPKRLWLAQDKKAWQQWRALLEKTGLRTDEPVEYTVGIYEQGQLIATGSYQGKIIKCLAVCKNYQSENLLTSIITHLVERLRAVDQNHLFVYTKPENQAIFHSLGFQEILTTQTISFMELGAPSFNQYEAYLRSRKKEGQNQSAIVMNANPFTKGHQYLIETAAAESEQVYVFVLSEERSEFSARDRLEMVKMGVAHLKNVVVLTTNEYLVSSAVFPAYFLKERAPLELAQLQATFDAQLFKQKIAPILMIKRRYVGEEPFSPVTNKYNEAMKAVFYPEITLTIIPRLQVDDSIISATKVREAIQKNDLPLLKKFVPETTYMYLHKLKIIKE